MQPYDPFSRLASEVSHPEALIALELCLRFLTASTDDDLLTIRDMVAQQLSVRPRPIDPLEQLYTTISAAVRQRLDLLHAIHLWAQQQDPNARILDHDPASWAVELELHEQQQTITAAFDRREDTDLDDDTITLLVDGTPIAMRILDNGYFQL